MPLFPSPARNRSTLTLGACGVVCLGITALASLPAAQDRYEPEITTRGDPEAGRAYLLYGDYIGSGVPAELYEVLAQAQPPEEPRLERRGKSGDLPRSLNRFEMPSGAEVVAGVTCLGCHASMFRGELVIGMGNSLSDWTEGREFDAQRIRDLAGLIYEEQSPEMASLEQFLRGVEALQGKTAMPFRGVNPAFRFEELAAAHREPSDLSWQEQRVFEPLDRPFGSDVPAWFALEKKDKLYLNGLGRGAWTKGLQQINVVGIADASDAARNHEHMDDVLAYIYALEAPQYPGPIDRELALEGAEVFNRDCASCHGTYAGIGEGEETFPNKLIPADEVGTDPVYADALVEAPLTGWYHRSWYATSEPTSHAVPSRGYIAPPLDGIWATAPYLHNGSVPTLRALLNSDERPTFWRRSFDDEDYDLDAVGWRYTVEDGPIDAKTYDTTIPGYGNGGHTYSDDLSVRERRALLEYLKSL